MTNISLDWLLFAIIGIVLANYANPLWKKFNRYRVRAALKSTPVLVSAASSHGYLVQAGSGETPDGMYYSTLVGFDLAEEVNKDVVDLYSLELPFMSGVHLVGIPKMSSGRAVSIQQNGSSLEPVVLEGDYQNYFELFAEKNQQVQSRYVLDPAAMVFTVDFCKQYNWEILEDTLYFMSDESVPSFAIVDEFVKQIQPAVAVASNRRTNPARMPYVNQGVRTMYCPMCKDKLVLEKNWLSCPQGDGVLITGGQMANLRSDEKKLDAPTSAKPLPDQTRQLHCPFCHSAMKSQRYQFTPFFVDVCSKCMFRWIDAGEMTQVL